MYLLRQNQEIKPIIWYYNFLSTEEIEKIIKYSNNLEFTAGSIQDNNLKDKKPFTLDYHIKDVNSGNVPRIRKSLIKWIELNDKTNWLYKKIILKIHETNQQNFDYILKYIENLQFTEYNENQKGFYSKHVDGSDSSLLDYVDKRKLSFTIQLTDPEEYDGGDLIFYINGEKTKAPKEKGTIIFFQSDILHEVIPVKRGVRHSLVSWIQGPNLR